MLKIGHLTFKKAAIAYIALLGIIIGIPIGFLVAYVQDTGETIPPYFLVPFLFGYNLLAFFALRKKISKNTISKEIE